MLIPAWLYTGLFYGLLGCTGIAVLYYAYRPKRAEDRLPRAEVVGWTWRALLPWLPRIGLLGVFGAWALSSCSIAVVKVSDTGGGDRTAKRYEYLGMPSFTYAPAEDQRTVDSVVGYDTWIVNDSSREIRLEVISYGRSLGWGSEPTVIPPGTAILTIGVQHLGPDDRPPSSVEVRGFAAKVGTTSRYWVTWDR